jgi:anti-sigma regulatory factor (Ser/Thr protein kinase)
MKEKFLYPSVVQSISSIRSDLKTLADTWKIPGPELKQITLIVEELFSKLVQVKSEGDGDQLLEISLTKTGTDIIIEMIDEGPPYNPLEFNPDQDFDPVLSDEGGMGLSLIKAFSDSIQYTREEGRNILLIQKIIRSQTEN